MKDNTKKAYGTLYLIPTTLGSEDVNGVIPAYVKDVVNRIEHFVVENESTARRYLRKLNIQKPIDELTLYVLDKRSKGEEVSEYINVLLLGKDMGVISEAGCPSVADPGSEIVRQAHQHNINVVPLVGPSSIVLALMASGFSGQNFVFHGYLPKERNPRIGKLKELEANISRHNQTQIFMETPFRNNHILEDILKTCSDKTKLCIASEITTNNEFIKTRSVYEWKQNVPDLNKRPTIFLLYK